MRTIIVSVGTSLIANYARARQLPHGMQPTSGELIAFLKETTAREASAESNTLACLDLAPSDQLTWLHSDTPEGAACAAALRDRYEASGWRGNLRRIEGLTYHQGTFVERGLRNLVETVCAISREAQRAGRDVVLCATGGFKAEIAYLTLLGVLLGHPIHYIHERFDTLITLPPLPLEWNSAFVAQHESFFTWIEADMRTTAEVETWLKAAPELRPLVVENADGNSYLSAAGLLLYDAYRAHNQTEPRAVWPPESTRCPAEKDIVSNEEHKRPRGWERFVRKLTEVDCVDLVSYAGIGHGRGGAGPRVFASDTQTGTLGIVIGDTDDELPLWVATTATSPAQLGLVRRWIVRNMGKW